MHRKRAIAAAALLVVVASVYITAAEPAVDSAAPATAGSAQSPAPAVPKSVGPSQAETPAPPSAKLPPIAFLYHNDPDVRIRTFRAYAATRDPNLVDDLIRAYSVESDDARDACREALRDLTGKSMDVVAAKAWLDSEVAAGRLKVEYLPIDLGTLAPEEQARIDPLIARSGPECFDKMAEVLTAPSADVTGDSRLFFEAAVYMVFNDNLPKVREFVLGDWLGKSLARRFEGGSLAYLHFPEGMVDAGPLKERMRTQLRACLDSQNPLVVANALQMIGDIEGFYGPAPAVPDTIDRVRELTKSADPEVSRLAHGAVKKLDPMGPECFEDVSATLTGSGPGDIASALKYVTVNHAKPEVQEFLRGDWLSKLFTREFGNGDVAALANYLAGCDVPRDNINAQVRAALDSGSPTAAANALHLLVGPEGRAAAPFIVPGVADSIRPLVDSTVPEVAKQARRAIEKLDPQWLASKFTYEDAFADLYDTLGRQYPCFDLKGIDWKAVGSELLPRAKAVKTDEEFGLLCMELVARLEDSHAALLSGTAKLPVVPLPQWDPGFACLIDDRDKPVVYYVDDSGPAKSAGVEPGMTVLSIDGQDASAAVQSVMKEASRYYGYSSDRYLRYHAAQWIGRKMEKGAIVALVTQDTAGGTKTFELPATMGVRYLPRLPVPIEGIADSGDVSWKLPRDNIGYIYVRRIGDKLIERLDEASGELKAASGLIIDVRGNSGGGFDSERSFRNFSPEDPNEPDRPRFAGPIAVLIDARCISAGEGWASWFMAKKRARFFGETTAGASSRKTTYTLKNGLFEVTFPVKAYTGFLDRPIERRGLEPDVPVRQNARDLARGRDTVLEAAIVYLRDLAVAPAKTQ